ncbi:hypothetical protein [Acinetobacter sp. MD2(2019)]|uniref:hypothetical protein n=1 Tax=Acinetobacter sp. MD2(2019) TaxID=2605273 RepID=UPI002D785342|nr:hypothetical protein [Acinetobacter sp. MD2(2019)]
MGSIVTIKAYAASDYFCFSSGGKNLLLVPANFLEVRELKYSPYLKRVALSKVIKTEYEDDAGFKPQIYYTMNEIVDHQVSGRYRFMVQGYLIYEVSYFNTKNKQRTDFSRLYSEDVTLKNIRCI